MFKEQIPQINIDYWFKQEMLQYKRPRGRRQVAGILR